jgi:hypothetical protein
MPPARGSDKYEQILQAVFSANNLDTLQRAAGYLQRFQRGAGPFALSRSATLARAIVIRASRLASTWAERHLNDPKANARLRNLIQTFGVQNWASQVQTLDARVQDWWRSVQDSVSSPLLGFEGSDLQRIQDTARTWTEEGLRLRRAITGDPRWEPSGEWGTTNPNPYYDRRKDKTRKRRRSQNREFVLTGWATRYSGRDHSRNYTQRGETIIINPHKRYGKRIVFGPNAGPDTPGPGPRPIPRPPPPRPKPKGPVAPPRFVNRPFNNQYWHDPRKAKTPKEFAQNIRWKSTVFYYSPLRKKWMYVRNGPKGGEGVVTPKYKTLWRQFQAATKHYGWTGRLNQPFHTKSGQGYITYSNYKLYDGPPGTRPSTAPTAGPDRNDPDGCHYNPDGSGNCPNPVPGLPHTGLVNQPRS